MFTSYRYRDLRTKVTYFRGSPRFGRTTALVHVPTGTVLFEVMGVVGKSALHIAYLAAKCRENAEREAAKKS